MSCVSGVSGTNGTTFVHAIDKAKIESKTKQKAAASGNLQDFMDAISHQPSKWEDLKHCRITHNFWGGFGTYLGQHAKKKMMVKIPLIRKNYKGG